MSRAYGAWALGMVYPALTGWAKGCRASGAFWGMGEARKETRWVYALQIKTV